MEGEAQSHSAEEFRGAAIWTPQDLCLYLLALAYNVPGARDFRLELEKFPRQIALSKTWHETFGRMRVETARDDRERWTLIGTTQERDKLVISEHLVVGQRGRVSRDLISRAVSEAKKHGITYLGDIHTHSPRPGEWKFDQGKLLRVSNDTFSVSDMHRLLIPNSSPGLMVLVGPSENVAAFQSKQTVFATTSWNGKTFEQYWSNQGTTNNCRNLEIVKRHNLVLYKGKPDQPLIRIPLETVEDS